MRVLRIDSAHDLAVCEDEGGSHRTVEIGLIDPVQAGDRVLVHADVALAALGEPA
jgi:hydrogenase maturation factor